MYKKQIYITLLLLFQYIQPGLAQQDGGMPGEFLRWGIGGRAMGLGRAYTALAENATSGYWNAAGLAEDPVAYGVEPGHYLNLNRMKFAFTYFRLFEETDFFGLSTAYSYNKYVSFGLSLLCLSTDGIEMWNNEFDLTPSGVLSANKFAVLLSYACRFKEWKTLDVGATVKYVQQSFSSSNYKRKSNFGLDLALRWRPFAFPMYWGLNIQNVNASISEMKLGEDQIPWSIRTGWGWSIFSRQYFKLLVVLDYEAINHRDPEWSHFRGGAELQLGNIISVRIGTARNEFHFGIGFSKIPHVNGLSIDLAHSDHKQNNLNHGMRTSIIWDGNLLSFQQWYEEAISDSNWGKGRSKGLLQKIIDLYPDPITVAQCYARFGDYEYEMQNFDKASKYYDKVFQIAEKIDSSKRNDIYCERYDYKETKLRVFRTHINHLMASIKLVRGGKIPWTALRKTYDSYCDLLNESVKQEWWFYYCHNIIFDKINPIMSKADTCCKLCRNQYQFLIDSSQTAANLRTSFHFDLAGCLLDTCFSDSCFNKKNDTFNFLVNTYKKQAAMPEDTVKFNIPDNYLAIDSIKVLAKKFEVSFKKDDVPGFILQYIIKKAIKNDKQWSKAGEIYHFYDDWNTKNVSKDSMFNYYGAVIYHKNAELYNDTWNLAEERYKFLIDSTKFADSLKVIFKLNHAICQLNSKDTTAEKSLRGMAMAIPENCAKSDPLGVFIFNDKCIIDDAQYCLAEYFCSIGDTDKAILEFAKILLLFPDLDRACLAHKKLKQLLSPFNQEITFKNIDTLQVRITDIINFNFLYPYDIDIDDNDTIYVADAGNQAITKFHKNNNKIVSIKDSKLMFPVENLIDTRNKTLYTADPRKNRIFWSHISRSKLYEVLFKDSMTIKPLDVDILNDNFLYIVDLLNESILKFNRTTKKIDTKIKDCVIFPIKIAVNEIDKNIFVADWGLQRIVRLDANGKCTNVIKGLGKCWFPIHIDFDINNNNLKLLYVMYWNLASNKTKIIKYAIKNKEIEPIEMAELNSLFCSSTKFEGDIFYTLEYGSTSKIKRIELFR